MFLKVKGSENTSKEVCGKTLKIYRNNKTGEYSWNLVRCKKLECPQCSQVIKSNFLMRLNYNVNLNGLLFFLTITTVSLDSKYLVRWFDNIRKRVGELYSRESITEEMIEKDTYYNLLCFTKTKNNYINVIDIAVQLTKYKNAREKYEKHLKLLWKENYLSKYSYYKLKDMELKHSKYKDMKGHEKFEMKKDFYEFFIAEIKRRIPKDSMLYKEWESKIRDRFNHNYGNGFEYVKVLEYQKQAKRAHFHCLVSKYVPNCLLFELSDTNAFIYDNSFCKEQENFNIDRVAEYIGKYITKDVMDSATELQKENENIQVLTHSHNCQVTLEYNSSNDEKRNEWTPIKTVHDKVITAHIGDNRTFKDYDGFMNNLLDVFEIDNELYKAIAQYEKNYLKSRRLLQKCSGVVEGRHGKEKAKDFKETWYKDLNRSHMLQIDLISAKMLTYELERRKNIEVSRFKLKENAEEHLKFADEYQRKFIETVVNSDKPITVLTGSAGTGKSTVISTMLRSLQISGKKILIVSLTGKAVSRSEEILGNIDDVSEGEIICKTMHKICNADFNEMEFPRFSFNEKNSLHYDMIVVEESSMISRLLLSFFLQACDTRAKIVFVGDRNQLPPIQQTSIFDEILSGDIPEEFYDFIELKKIHRSTDSIISMAHKVLKGEYKDFKAYDIDCIREKYKEGYQILCSTNKLVRDICTQILTDKTDIIINDYKRYNVGDKVMATSNNSRIANGIFNGQVFKLERFEGNEIVLTRNCKEFKLDIIKFNTLMVPAVCISIHKSQGSEYSKVLAIWDNEKRLVSRNILYTAVTRAKESALTMSMFSEKKEEIEAFGKASIPKMVYKAFSYDTNNNFIKVHSEVVLYEQLLNNYVNDNVM